MAGSQRGPLMNDQWRADIDHKDKDFDPPRPRDRERPRPERRRLSPSSSHRGRGRDRERPGRGRGAFIGNHRPPARYPASRRAEKKANSNRRPPFLSHQHPNQLDNQGPTHSLEDQVSSRPRTREGSLPPSPSVGPLPKRRRTRSPSPHNRRHHRSKRRDSRSRDRSGKGRGFPDWDISSRRSPQRGRERRPTTYRSEGPASDSFSQSRPRRSRSPVARGPSRDYSPHRYERTDEQDFSSRPSSGHSALPRVPRETPPRSPVLRENPDMQSTHPIQSIACDSRRSPPPLRPIPSFDTGPSGDGVDGNPRDSFPIHDMRPSDSRSSRRPSRPHVDTRQQYATSPQYVTPTGSRHTSPQSGSPYSSGRGSWGGQQQQPYAGQQGPMHGYSPPYRQNSVSSQSGSQSQYYQSQQGQYPPGPNHPQSGYSGPPYPGGRGGYRGNNYTQPPDRRFSGPNSQAYGSNQQQQRSRGTHFSNLQWTASSGRGRGSNQGHSGPPHLQSGPPQHPPHPNDRPMSPDMDESDNPFRPSKDLQVEDQDSKPDGENGDVKRMAPPPPPQPSGLSQPKEAGKFSFAFKSKAASTTAPKPVTDLAQRMREPPSRPVDESKHRKPSGPAPRDKHENRFDRRDERRDSRRGDRRFDHRAERPRGRREDRRVDHRYDRRHDRSPERKKPKKIMKRLKPRPTLSEEFAQSDSVYYRKPGNESVIGAGTYGKVFKAIHVYTKNKVALKKIRMEGEKDGFPITAVREIRLLQHLRHENVVRLQEVMVEKNECFMVFEYLSHDLTGLINHPTFALTPSHKKHLAMQMFEGLNYLHHRGVLHRDIKAANILISNQGQLKFADFGLARFFSKSQQLDYTNRVITIWYRPPELLLGETRYGPAVDIWSAACVYMEMFTKKAVFPGEGGEISQLDKLYNSLGTPTRSDWPDIVEMPWFELLRPKERKKRAFEDLYRDFISPAALDLVGKMFHYDPAKRPSAEEVLNHPYFTTEEPVPQQAIELANIEGDWHEFESKAARKERDKEARRLEYQREKEKRKASEGASTLSGDRDAKRTKLDEDAAQSQGLEN
ncbi:CMGC/CDK/CRK7 protein kinase [Polytolypa hystricis UAMH7299]|uniref:cyclin-dependent kinase n=1 Tax=Polytolypa hystricis (strain UAMH7299) TaxID=1447883 RepID=A0A2B7XKY7_POLH7|nr:CMGC/CDK/CRK7 protein kinase [Polytolypa hystricis UAMH7299]